MSPRDSTLGFTLIELLTVVALLAIFASIAIPSFSRMIEGNRVQSTASEFYRALQSARSDAVTLRTVFTACKKTPSSWEIRSGAGCSGIDSAVSWAGQVPPSVTTCWTAIGIQFNPNGTASKGSLRFSSSQSSEPHWVTVHPSGHISRTPPEDDTCS
jgi:type IV fimbrial biogenesis protein FimT/type IV fimbrial biogenesis protein FimU